MKRVILLGIGLAGVGFVAYLILKRGKAEVPTKPEIPTELEIPIEPEIPTKLEIPLLEKIVEILPKITVKEEPVVEEPVVEPVVKPVVEKPVVEGEIPLTDEEVNEVVQEITSQGSVYESEAYIAFKTQQMEEMYKRMQQMV